MGSYLSYFSFRSSAVNTVSQASLQGCLKENAGLETYCKECGKLGAVEVMLNCKRCKAVYYCSDSCKAKGAVNHSCKTSILTDNMIRQEFDAWIKGEYDFSDLARNIKKDPPEAVIVVVNDWDLFRENENCDIIKVSRTEILRDYSEFFSKDLKPEANTTLFVFAVHPWAGEALIFGVTTLRAVAK